MRPRHGGRLALLCVALLAGCVPDFGGFTVVDASTRDAGDAARDADTDAGTDGGMEPSPTAVDLVCELTWTNIIPGSPPPTCVGRELVDIANPIGRTVGIARASDGTITIAYNALDGVDSGSIETVSFAESDPTTLSQGPSITPVAAFGDVVGNDLAIATEAPNTHHLAYWLRSDSGNEVLYRTLREGVLGPVQSIATAVGPDGVVDVAVDTDGLAVVGWHDDTAGANAVRRERTDGSWANAVTLRNDGDARLAGWGAIALTPGPAGVMHAAYQWSVTLAASAPSYSMGTGTTWTSPRTLDNTTIADHASGVGVDVALVGNEVVAAYLHWIDGYAELRMARFSSTTVDPVVNRFLEGIMITDLPGSFPLALRVDSYGQLHMLLVDASTSGGTTTWLEYHRQIRVGGELRWVFDSIATLDGVIPDEVYLDMVIGPDRRPHMVYFDPTTGTLRYATIHPEPTP